MVSKRRCRHDDGDNGDGDDDGDGVRGLSHKRLRQLRWARALKTIVLPVLAPFFRGFKIFYKMAASGRTEVANDVKFGMGASLIELYLWSKFGDPSSYGVQTQMRHDGDGDGVRVLSHKRLRQLRWARALKTVKKFTQISVLMLWKQA